LVRKGNRTASVSEMLPTFAAVADTPPAQGIGRMSLRHLTVRAAWHDSAWNGRICAAPSANSYCLDLDRIRASRDDAAEDADAGIDISTLPAGRLPACQAESGMFMNPTAWTRTISHPYATGKKTKGTHGSLRPATVTVPPYSTFAIPFAWMLRSGQDELADRIGEHLPPDTEPPFHSSWVFSGQRQTALLDHVFGQLNPGRSLAVFYTKSGHPLGDDISRLVLGVGTLTALGGPILYPDGGGTLSEYPAWDRLVSHSIRPDGDKGFLLPYHAYLAPTGDPVEDARRAGLLREITVEAAAEHRGAFSHGAEIAGADVALSALVRCQAALRLVRTHGIAPGPWDLREDWLNQQIAQAWTDRGAFPGAGAALEAIGLRLGTSLVRELQATGALTPEQDPWPLLASLLEGTTAPPTPAYAGALADSHKVWAHLSKDPTRMAALRLLSRMDLTLAAASRWFRLAERGKATLFDVTDTALLANPYLLSEADLGDDVDLPIALSTVDAGMYPDDTVGVAHPLPATTPPFATASDARRIRAGLVTVLRQAERDGDTLLSDDETVTRLAAWALARPIVPTLDWVAAHAGDLSGTVEVLAIDEDPVENTHRTALQLTGRGQTAKVLSNKLSKRAAKAVPSTGESWTALLTARLKEQGVDTSAPSAREVDALAEQAAALETITTHRLAVLVGRAGTGKTTVLGALQNSPALRAAGMLFLAPTGKATVRLAQKTGTDAYTVAQFLYRAHRYDSKRQRPLFMPRSTGRGTASTAATMFGPATVVIDECSMLTEDDLRACLEALDLSAVQRLILVGDPNQLPPIGPGRPFADLVAHLDAAAGSADPVHAVRAGALAKLTVELRTTAGAPSQALRLASWFTSEPQPVDADEVMSELAPDLSALPAPTAALTAAPPALPLVPQQTTGAAPASPPSAAPAGPALLPTPTVGSAGSTSAQAPPTDSPPPATSTGDLHLRYWRTPAELHRVLQSAMAEALGMTGPDDLAGFDKALGFDSSGFVPFADHSGAERFQILSPVRMAPHGVFELNRMMQRTYRAADLQRRGGGMGAELIVAHDKVILLRNGARNGYDHGTASKVKNYLANGEVGLVSPTTGIRVTVAFAHRNYERYDFYSSDLPSSGGGNLELAYALTVHKAQGSEFDVVLVVVPATGRLMSRELIYTALTRAKTRLVLLVEGTDPGRLFTLASPEHSETARRNTNVFTDAVRQVDNSVPFAEHLIHRTSGGLYVRSKSELIIANLLENEGVPFRYEPVLRGAATGGYRRPDFTFASDSGDTIVWEHLGMMDRQDYRDGWTTKSAWYATNGFTEPVNLFTTREGEHAGGLDMTELQGTLKKVRDAMDD
jgi:hypothetical protein